MICLFICLCLTSCSESVKNEEDGFRLYYINAEETLIVSEPYEPVSNNTEDFIDEMIKALNISPDNDKYKKAKPDAVAIIDYFYEKEKPLTINFDSTYYALSGTTEILCRAAIVSMFCQIDGVELVEFHVGGQPLVLSGETPVGLMSNNDFLIVDGAVINHKEVAQVTVYFADEAGNVLIPYHVSVSYDGFISKEQLIVRLLLLGPKEDEGVYNAIPEGTKINKVSVKDRICYVDLSSEFLEKCPGISEEVTIYSIVNSLVEQTSVTKVQFLINGEQKKTYQNMDFSVLFERDLTLIENEY